MARKPCKDMERFAERSSCSTTLSTVFAVLTLSTLQAAGDSPVDFVTQIKPILADRWVECHNSETLLGELNLQMRALA